MTTTFSENNSPLSRLLSDDNITIMEEIIPYCPVPLGRALALQMKFMEIQKILSSFDDEPYLRACGFEDQSVDIEALLRSIRHSVSEEKAKQIDTVLNMIQFSKMYQTYQNIMQTHPEFLKGQEHSSSDSSPDNEKLKSLLNFATKSNGENIELADLLSTFLKK